MLSAGGAARQLDSVSDELRADVGRRREAPHVPRGESQRHHAAHGDLLDH